jgi:hypothetical protein
MSARRFLLPLFALAAMVSVAFMCSLGGASSESAAPIPQETAPAAEEIPSDGGMLPTPTRAIAATSQAPQPAIPEARRLTLEFPSRIKAGDSDIIRLTLEVDEFGNLTPTSQIEGNVVTGERILIPNLYETHNVIAEARLDMAGMQVSPSETTYEPLLPGQSVTFLWSVRPDGTGFYRGTAWLHLHFVNKVSGQESRRAISAQIVELEAVNFFGLSADFARGAGAIGSLIGGILGFPFIDDLLKFLLRRFRK